MNIIKVKSHGVRKRHGENVDSTQACGEKRIQWTCSGKVRGHLDLTRLPIVITTQKKKKSGMLSFPCEEVKIGDQLQVDCLKNNKSVTAKQHSKKQINKFKNDVKCCKHQRHSNRLCMCEKQAA